MSTATAAMAFGVVFILVGISGFFAAPPSPDAPPLTMEHGHGLALGMFPINTLHNVVHLLFGVLGLAAWRSGATAPRMYFQIVAIAYGLLVVLGLIPATHTTFGLIPIWGNDVWLHGVIALVAAYFGFMAPVSAPLARRM
jgi:hypothetical protein